MNINNIELVSDHMEHEYDSNDLPARSFEIKLFNRTHKSELCLTKLLIDAPILYIEKQVKSICSVLKFECPSDAKAVFLDTHKNQVYDLTSISRCIEYIQFGDHFNQPIEKNDLPAGLKILVLGIEYNQPIKKNVLPPRLKTLVISNHYNQPIKKNVLPTGLKTLMLDIEYNQSTNRMVTIMTDKLIWMYYPQN